MPQLLEWREAAVRGLSYAAVGRGEPLLVAVNALGQALTAWLPLADRLSRKHRVVLWELRETDPVGQPIPFAEHYEDLRAVVEQEGARTCHLIGWGTGVKLAVRYCRTHPGAVAFMVLLSGSFKHPGRPPDLDTAYERNLETMLRAVVQYPALAEKLRGLLLQAVTGGGAPGRMDGDALAVRALTGIPVSLAHDVRRPFRDTAALSAYAQQHLDFWSSHEGSVIGVPVLGLAGEYDGIVSPAGFCGAMARFPVSRFETIAGASHHFFYERPDTVASRIEHWIERAQ